MNRQYVNAEYDAERGSYISSEADWIDGEPSLEYRFTVEQDADNPHSWSEERTGFKENGDLE